jgi:hypothetical protein
LENISQGGELLESWLILVVGPYVSTRILGQRILILIILGSRILGQRILSKSAAYKRDAWTQQKKKEGRRELKGERVSAEEERACEWK